MSDVRSTLDHLGDALEDAAAADLYRPRCWPAARTPTPGPPQAAAGGRGRWSWSSPAPRWPPTACSSTSEDVAASLPAGTLALAGTNPTCTVVRENVEYHCVLEKAPAPEVEDWKGTVEPSVDATSHVNGGCRSLNSAGTEWSCYIGQEAVDQQIIGPALLGEFSSGPGVG